MQTDPSMRLLYKAHLSEEFVATRPVEAEGPHMVTLHLIDVPAASAQVRHSYLIRLSYLYSITLQVELFHLTHMSIIRQEMLVWSQRSPLCAWGLHQYEHKISVLHVLLKRTTEYNDPVKGKSLMDLHVGFRRMQVSTAQYGRMRLMRHFLFLCSCSSFADVYLVDSLIRLVPFTPHTTPTSTSPWSTDSSRRAPTLSRLFMVASHFLPPPS